MHSVSSRFGQVMEKIKNWDSMFYTCMSRGFYLDLRSISIERSAQTYEEWSNLIAFSRLGLVFFSKLHVWNNKHARFSFVPDCFHFPFWWRSPRRGAQIYKKLSFTGFFTRLGPFPHVFRHVKMWLILELHEIIRVSHLVTCPVVFILFNDWGWHGGVTKIVKKDHFLVLIVVWVPVPKFLAKLKSGLY